VDRAQFIRGWGSGAGGYHLAVDLRGPVGAPIRAAERGIVAYSGDGLSGYGNFVMLVHPDGRVTAYAHNRENLVAPGQLVRRGQTIARLGNTGRSQGPHLHFMLVRDGEHCDPLPLFSPAPGRRGPRPRVRGAVARGGTPLQCLPRSARPHPGHAGEADGDDEPVPPLEGPDSGAGEDDVAPERSEASTGAAPSE
jgi:murein DD-endopeptidase MepM/ murein hydrolase activator NlpD